MLLLGASGLFGAAWLLYKASQVQAGMDTESAALSNRRSAGSKKSSEPLKYVLRLSGFDTSRDRGYTVYFVRVAVESGLPNTSSRKRLWFIEKRFRDFYKLQRAIIEANGVAPQLPEKRYFGNTDPLFVQDRARGLSTFLWQLAASPPLCALRCVQEFLCSNICVPTARSLLPSTPATSCTSLSELERVTNSSSLASVGFGPEDMDRFRLDCEGDVQTRDSQERGGRRRRVEEQIIHQSSADIADLQGCMIIRSAEDLQRSFAREGISFPEADLEDADASDSDSDDTYLKKTCSSFMPGLYKWYTGANNNKQHREAKSLGTKASEEEEEEERFDPRMYHARKEAMDEQEKALEDAQVRATLLPKLRFVIIVVGSRGDVQPYIALGMALRHLGHYVRITAHECFRQFVLDHGLGFAPLAGDPKELLRMVTENNMFSFRFVKEGITSHRTWVSHVLDDAWDACTLPEDKLRQGPDAPRVERQDTKRNVGFGPGFAFAALKSSFRADVVIANPPSFVGWHIAEALGVPLFMSFPMPWSRTKEFPSPFTNMQGDGPSAQLNWMSYGAVDRLIWLGTGDLVNRWRVKTLRIPPIWTMSARGHRLLHDNKVPFVYPWSPQLLPKPKDWSAHISIPGYWFLDDEIEKERAARNASRDSQHSSNETAVAAAAMKEYEPPAELERFFRQGQDPPIFIGFGSIVVAKPKRLNDIIVETVVSLGVQHRFVVQAGWAQVNVDGIPEIMKSRVMMVGPVPHRWLFERCKLIVHHGGAGTTAESLRAGKPSVVVPFFGDQFFWARQVHETRVGTKVPYSELSESKLRKAIEAALGPGPRMRSQVMGNAIRNEKGVENGIAFIERRLLAMETMPHAGSPTTFPSSPPGASSPVRVSSSDVEDDSYEGWVQRNLQRCDHWRYWPYVNLSDKPKTSMMKKPISDIGKRVKVVGSAIKHTVSYASSGGNSGGEGSDYKGGVELQTLEKKEAIPFRKLPSKRFTSTIPDSHTRFSWGIAGSRVPLSHTAFSWGSDKTK